MSRKNGDYRTFYTLVKLTIALLIGFITISYKFLKNVNRMNLWKELFLSLFLLLLVFFIGFCTNSAETGGLFAIFGIIGFCCWWNNKLSYADTHLNEKFWQQRQWWWTLDGWQFEQEVARIFRLNGYKATVTKGSGDGGVDIIITKEGYRAIVQCKHYKKPVPPEPCRALWGCKDDFKADEVIMVASSGLTTASSQFIQNKPTFKVLNLDDIVLMSQHIQSDEQKLFNNEIKNQTKISTGRRLDI